jgi:hypothetical protein
VQLVKLRVYMEKMKPIDQKLKYQIDKLVRLAVTGAAPQGKIFSQKYLVFDWKSCACR